MKANRLLHSMGLLLVAGLILSGCTNSSPTKHGKTASSSEQSSAPVNQSSSTTMNKKQSTTLWNDSKDQKLEQFINDWAPSMHQSYQKYSGQGNIRTKSGMEYPSDFNKTTVNGTNDSIGWAPSGKGPYSYNVVAIYNYDRPGNAATLLSRVTYNEGCLTIRLGPYSPAISVGLVGIGLGANPCPDTVLGAHIARIG